MNTLITPIVLLILSIALFFSFTEKQYAEVKTLKIQNAEYEVAIDNSRKLLSTRDQLLAQYNSFPAEELARLEKLVPDSIDNVRLIIDINGVTAKYGIPIKNIKINSVSGGEGENIDDSTDTSPYRSATLSFSLNAPYETFLKIIEDLEKSLRILDISTIKFTATDREPYEYDVTVTAYWMK